MARRSIVPTIFIALLVAACGSPIKPTVAPAATQVAAIVTAPPTATPTATPTQAPPTKAPKPTKKPKPTPTPVAWSKDYRSSACAAIGYLSQATTHVDAAGARLAASDTPHARAEAFLVISLSVQATNAVSGLHGWSPGDDLRHLLASSASGLGDGATQFLDGLTALNFDVIHKAQAEMVAGSDQLAAATSAITDLSTTYGPAGC